MATKLNSYDYLPHDYIEYTISKYSPDKYIVRVDDIEGGSRYTWHSWNTVT